LFEIYINYVSFFYFSGNVYFVTVGDNTINCWNSNTPYVAKNIHKLFTDDTNLQFATGIKVVNQENDYGCIHFSIKLKA